jgi:uncharacterized protein YdhG (YjbR/CyaY superfamily)
MTPAKSTTTIKKSTVWTDEEKAAMKALAKERKAEANREEGEAAALAAIAGMQEPDRSMAKRIHALIKTNAPELAAKTWYGMPAYVNEEGKVVCDFKPAQKFNSRYATLEFQDAANLDEGAMWSTSFALKELTADAEATIVALVKKAIG